MDERALEMLRFPIGRDPKVTGYDAEAVARGIADLEAFPAQLRKRAEGLSEGDLEIRYRPEGWTVRQVIHHVADSHINSYTRFKLALTEDKPVIKPYFEDRWAELPDGKVGNIKVSLALVEAVHDRLCALLRTLDREALARAFFHPEHGKEIYLYQSVGTYAWHGKHHLAHIDLALGG